MSPFKKVLVNSGYLLGFRILSRLLSVIFLVYAASRLGPQLFGALSFVLVTVELLGSISDLGITRYGSRELIRNSGQRPALAGQILVLQVLTSVPLAAAGLAAVLIFNPGYPKLQLLMIGMASFFLYSVINTTEAIFTSVQRFFYSASLAFFGRLVYTLAGISALLAGFSVVVVMWAFFAAIVFEMVLRIIMVIVKVTRFSFHFPASGVWRMLVLTMPFAVAGIANIIALRINVVILEFIKGDAQVGIYNMAFTLFTPFIWLSYIIGLATFPALTETYMKNRQSAKRQFWQWYRIMSLVGIPAAVAVSLLAKPVLLHFPSGYSDSAAVLIILSWQAPLVLLTSVSYNVLQIADREHYLVISLVLGAIATAAFSFLLVPFWGEIGAAFAALLGTAVKQMHIQHEVYHRVLKQRALQLFVRPAIAGVVMIALTVLMAMANIWLAAVVGMVAYTITIFATGAVRFSEFKMLTHI